MIDQRRIKAGSRVFLVTVTGVVVDVRDCVSGTEAQALTGPGLLWPGVLADSQVRDAIASAYYNATARESGRYPVGGTSLPDGFAIEKI